MKRSEIIIPGIFLFGLSACLEPQADTDAIVHVGNGADWSQVLVADVVRHETTESLVIKDSSVETLDQKLPVPSETSLVVEAVAQAKEGNAIIQIAEAPKNVVQRTSQEVESSKDLCSIFIIAPTGETECLRDSSIRSLRSPHWTQDGDLYFIDQGNQLRKLDKAKSLETLDRDVSEFRMSPNGKFLYVFKPNEGWIFQNENLGPKGIAWMAQDGSFYYYLTQTGFGVSRDLDKFQLYKFDPGEKKFKSVWTHPSTIRLRDWKLADSSSEHSKIYLLAKIYYSDLSRLMTRVLSIGEEGIQALPVDLSLDDDQNTKLHVDRERLLLKGEGDRAVLTLCALTPQEQSLCKKLESPDGYEIYDGIVAKDQLVVAARALPPSNSTDSLEENVILTLIPDLHAEAFGAILTEQYLEGSVQSFKFFK